MQYMPITKDMTLSKLSSVVGERNVDAILNANSIQRSVNIGETFKRQIDSLKYQAPKPEYQQKLSILNQFAGDSDLYEKAALGTEDSWKALANYNCFPDAIRIPEDVQLSSSVNLLGNGEPVPSSIYKACSAVLIDNRDIDPAIFAEYNAAFSGGTYGVVPDQVVSWVDAYKYFKVPWGKVCLYSSLNPDEMLYFPVYPKELSDGSSANFEEMGEMLYQYEPWKVYKSSGPREMNFTFEFHRDMWTGDHRDGAANSLVRGCQANCFPRYNGSLVNVATVTLYINGENYITGVMTDCKVEWSGPIGLDGFYLKCNLSFSITEISPQPLNYVSVRQKGLIS